MAELSGVGLDELLVKKMDVLAFKFRLESTTAITVLFLLSESLLTKGFTLKLLRALISQTLLLLIVRDKRSDSIHFGVRVCLRLLTRRPGYFSSLQPYCV